MLSRDFEEQVGNNNSWTWFKMGCPAFEAVSIDPEGYPTNQPAISDDQEIVVVFNREVDEDSFDLENGTASFVFYSNQTPELDGTLRLEEDETGVKNTVIFTPQGGLECDMGSYYFELNGVRDTLGSEPESTPWTWFQMDC